MPGFVAGATSLQKCGREAGRPRQGKAGKQASKQASHLQGRGLRHGGYPYLLDQKVKQNRHLFFPCPSSPISASPTNTGPSFPKPSKGKFGSGRRDITKCRSPSALSLGLARLESRVPASISPAGTHVSNSGYSAMPCTSRARI